MSPEAQLQTTSRRTTKSENPDTWSHSTGREIRESRDKRESRDTRDMSRSRDSHDSRDTHQREYSRTPPSEWKSYTQRRMLYPSQMDHDCVSDLARKREEEEDEDEAYWASVRTLYEKTPNCSRPRPVSRAASPGYPGFTPTRPSPEAWLLPTVQGSSLRPQPLLPKPPPLPCTLQDPILGCLQHPNPPSQAHLFAPHPTPA